MYIASLKRKVLDHYFWDIEVSVTLLICLLTIISRLRNKLSKLTEWSWLRKFSWLTKFISNQLDFVNRDPGV